MTWRAEFAAIIRDATEHLPKETQLQDRIKTVDAARPKHGYMTASWPQKAWQAARRDYLIPFGYIPKTKKQADIDAAVIEALPLFAPKENEL